MKFNMFSHVVFGSVISILLGCLLLTYRYIGPQGAPTLTKCLVNIQRVDDSATSVTAGDGIVYESFICETADYTYVITRDRRLEVQR